MIQADNISMAFQGEPLFQGGSFLINLGEKLGLVGRNGSGKTTLIKLISNELLPDTGAITIKKGYKLGTLKQHLNFTKPTLLEEAKEALVEKDDHHIWKAEKILFGLGFKEEAMDMPPQNFSGGFQLRLSLAKTLIGEPDCLLLDEPTNYLDIVSLSWLSKFLKTWPKELVLITHDRAFMDAVTNCTLGIHRHAFRKVKGGTKNYFDQILVEEEIHERTREKTEKKREEKRAWIERFGAKATKAKQAKSMEKELERLPSLEKLLQIRGLDFRFRECPLPSKKALEATNLSFSWNEEPLIEGFSLTVEKGERVAIIGKNGRGKSTLLSLLAKDLEPQKGKLKYAETLQVGYFGQTHIDRLSSERSIEEEISLANSDLKRGEVKSIAGLMLFSGALSEKKTAILSGGERARVLLGKIIATPCNLLLLDEPTHHLDMESIEALIEALDAFESSLIIVTHSEDLLQRLPFTKLVVMRQTGHEVFLGSYQDFLESGGWDEEGGDKPKKKSKGSDRHERAMIVQERSKMLAPLKKKMAKLEQHIQADEIRLAALHDELQEASLSNHSKKIQELSIELSKLNKSLESNYEELENTINEIESI